MRRKEIKSLSKLLEKNIGFFLIAISAFLITSCASYEKFHQMSQQLEIPSRVYQSDYTKTWQAVLQVMRRYDLAVQNQQSGVIRTRWIDNTLELNFADSFGASDSVRAARFKLVINVVKGFRGDREVSRVSVYKRQMVERDFLQGWQVVNSDGIQEETILYRIERLLAIEERLEQIEQQRARELEDNF